MYAHERHPKSPSHIGTIIVKNAFEHPHASERHDLSPCFWGHAYLHVKCVNNNLWTFIGVCPVRVG